MKKKSMISFRTFKKDVVSPFIIEKLMKAKHDPNGKISVVIKKQLKSKFSQYQDSEWE